MNASNRVRCNSAVHIPHPVTYTRPLSTNSFSSLPIVQQQMQIDNAGYMASFVLWVP